MSSYVTGDMTGQDDYLEDQQCRSWVGFAGTLYGCEQAAGHDVERSPHSAVEVAEDGREIALTWWIEPERPTFDAGFSCYCVCHGNSDVEQCPCCTLPSSSEHPARTS